ncbi:divisome protein SepX/GlpR [Streptomyces pseudovenezuelae]|uniref:Type II secretory pathway pseudopilin PulG n=1 Tax=Streptomyces pseudovenezuelae TaxID=67350 RepID=A0ABT6M171_9ACTN|nr:gephyrin-like molybdotransferase receptor GlpR [Streptomyces pseudovenezuelae]MDH6222300.1 type II secretory pathway pseudopilin PulG [Streptomyces pseudovenezuelae]
MSSSGLIYAVIVGAWAAYLVPMWLRRQDELNEARPTERFSTAIRLLSGRAGMERRYAKDLRARSTEEEEPSADAPDVVTDSVDVRAFATPPARPQVRADVKAPAAGRAQPAREQREKRESADAPGAAAPAAGTGSAQAPSSKPARTSRPAPARASHSAPAPESGSAPARKRVPAARRSPAAEAAAARARRTKVLARRRRTTVMLFLAFTLGTIVAAVGGLAFLWAPGVPAILLSGYIVYLRSQEQRRFTYQMDRRLAEAAAQRLRERQRQPRRRAAAEAPADEPEGAPEQELDPGLSALAADRRALVEQTDHAEWVDQQRERQRRPGHGDSWDPVPVPLPTYVTAPVAPRATADVDLGAPDAWSSARSSSVARDQEAEARSGAEPCEDAQVDPADDNSDAEADGDGRSDARRAASARRARERGRTPLFDQYEDGERPRAANE